MDMGRESTEFKSLSAGIRARVAEGFGELKGGPGSGRHAEGAQKMKNQLANKFPVGNRYTTNLGVVEVRGHEGQKIIVSDTMGKEFKVLPSKLNTPF